MKKFLLSTAILSALVVGGCATSTGSNTSTDLAKETVATYTDGEVTQAELYDRMKTSYGETTLQQMLIEEVLSSKYGKDVTDEAVQKALDEEKTFYGTEDEFTETLSMSGYTEDSYKDIIRYSMLMEATVKANTKFTDDEIKTAYDAYVAPVKAAHILVTDEDVAKDLIKQINDGGDFATLAKEKSEDTGTAENGGELTFTTGEMVPEFEKAALALEEGVMTPEPVATEYGFHIIKMIEKPEKGTLEEEKETIETSLMSAKLADTEYVSGIITEVLTDAGIKITDKDLEKAMDAYLKPAVEETTESEVTEDAVEKDVKSDEATTESEKETKESDKSTTESGKSE